jgi:hypothetical protein
VSVHGFKRSHLYWSGELCEGPGFNINARFHISITKNFIEDEQEKVIF